MLRALAPALADDRADRDGHGGLHVGLEAPQAEPVHDGAIALRSGESLSDHANPGEATVQVLQGRVTLRFGEVSWNGSPGDLLIVPDGIHALDAVEDSVVLLTVVKLA